MNIRRAGRPFLAHAGQTRWLDHAARHRPQHGAPVRDPYYALVFQGQRSNVDTVMVDGRVLVLGRRDWIW